MKLHPATTIAIAAATIALLACGTPASDNSGTGTGIHEVPASASATPAGSVAPAVATSKAPTIKTWGDGTYEVGSEIPAGKYKTVGTHDSCYWARLKDTSGALDDISANGNISADATGRLTVKSTDKYVEFDGGCTWVKA